MSAIATGCDQIWSESKKSGGRRSERCRYCRLFSRIRRRRLREGSVRCVLGKCFGATALIGLNEAQAMQDGLALVDVVALVQVLLDLLLDVAHAEHAHMMMI